jgi:hypothetical protein
MARSPFALWWDAAGVGYNLMLRSAEMAVASAQVISHRAETIGTACRDPAAADYPELIGMVAEKVEAFARANISLLQDLGQANVELLANATRLGRMTPIALAAESLRAGTRNSRMAERALRPIHHRATANARRLNRKKQRAG